VADTQFKDLTPAAAIEDDDELLVAKAAADDPAEFRRVPGTAVLRPGDPVPAGDVTGLAAVATSGAFGDLSNRPRLVQATVDFGSAETESARVTVVAAWVNASSIIVCSAAGIATLDHDAEDAAAEGVTAIATDIVDGVGFDVLASAPRGTWGRYVINCVGL
jgi:hypothetical protein